MDARSVDFRLLECLQTLVAEGNVTRAAERLGMSQPKLSTALARLRKLTGDPLLVRTPEGMIPTEMGRELAANSAAFLLQWKSVVGGDPNFKPELIDRTFKIQIADSLIVDAVVPALRHIREQAPDLRLSFTPPYISTMREMLETGEIDLVIGWVEPLPQDLFISQLAEMDMCCIAASDHPRISGQVTLDDYQREAHVLLTFGRSHMLSVAEQNRDHVLLQHGVRRKGGVFMASILAMPPVVAASDLIATLPRSVAEKAATQLPLKIYDLPVPMNPHRIAMIWHARTKNDPSSHWLRSVLRQTLTSETGPQT